MLAASSGDKVGQGVDVTVFVGKDVGLGCGVGEIVGTGIGVRVAVVVMIERVGARVIAVGKTISCLLEIVSVASTASLY